MQEQRVIMTGKQVELHNICHKWGIDESQPMLTKAPGDKLRREMKASKMRMVRAIGIRKTENRSDYSNVIESIVKPAAVP